MSDSEIGLRLSLKGRREAAAGLLEVGRAAEHAGALAKRGSSGFDRVASGIGSLIRSGARTAFLGIASGVTAVGAALAYTLVKGFSRLSAIDEAKAKLAGLGNSAKTVSKIMANALASVKGTAFGLDEAATVSAGAVAAGIKPGQDLTKTLKLVADAATIGGTSLGEMGAIFNKVAATGKVQGDVLAQLGDRGIPILQLLSKQLHISTADVLTMSKKGTIDFKTFSAAMQDGLGGAALKSGNTAAGAFANLKASISRSGAGFLGGLFDHLAPTLTGITKAMAPLEAGAASLGATIGRKLGPAMEKLGPFLAKTSAALSRGFKTNGLDGVAKVIQDRFGVDAPKALRLTRSVLQDVSTIVSKVLVPAFQDAAQVLPGFTSPLTMARDMLGFLADHTTLAKLAIEGLVIALTAAKVATLIATVATKAQAIWSGTVAIASGVWAAAQWLLNAALDANPIGLVVLAVAALAAGLFLAYKKSETFRNIVQSVFGFLKKQPQVLLLLLGPLGWVAAALIALWKNSQRFRTGVLEVAKGLLGMARFGILAFRLLMTAAFAAFDGILRAADKGLGWIPGLGSKIHSARQSFENFANGAIHALDAVDGKIRGAQGALDALAHPRTIDVTVAYHHTGVPQLPGAPVNLDLMPNPTPKRALGGPVYAGQSVIVGEHRPEVFRPRVSGTVLPRVSSTTQASIDGLAAAEEGGGAPIITRVYLDRRMIAEAVHEHERGTRARR